MLEEALERLAGELDRAQARSWVRVSVASSRAFHRAGLTLREARQILKASTFHGSLPEPLRPAHLIAGAYVTGRSKGGA